MNILASTLLVLLCGSSGTSAQEFIWRNCGNYCFLFKHKNLSFLHRWFHGHFQATCNRTSATSDNSIVCTLPFFKCHFKKKHTSWCWVIAGSQQNHQFWRNAISLHCTLPQWIRVMSLFILWHFSTKTKQITSLSLIFKIQTSMFMSD